MIIILGFIALSFIASTFVIAACALSSRISASQGWEDEFYLQPDAAWQTASQTTA